MQFWLYNGVLVDSSGNTYDSYETDGVYVYDNNNSQVGVLESGTPPYVSQTPNLINSTSPTTNNNTLNATQLASVLTSSAQVAGNTILASQGKSVTYVTSPTGVVTTSTGVASLFSSPIMLILILVLAFLLYKKFG